jgi:hypothetical protein
VFFKGFHALFLVQVVEYALLDEMLHLEIKKRKEKKRYYK